MGYAGGGGLNQGDRQLNWRGGGTAGGGEVAMLSAAAEDITKTTSI